MAQRRNSSSSGRGDAQSDLFDTKALAAKARSDTGGPVVRQNAAELSGVRPRRDSVIGARLTPPPRAKSSELPNWFWGVIGCLSVLLVGFVGLFVLARSGKLGALMPETAFAARAPSGAPREPGAAPAPTAPVAAGEPASAPVIVAPSEPAASARAAEEPRGKAPVAENAAHEAAVPVKHGTAHEHAAPAAPRPAAKTDVAGQGEGEADDAPEGKGAASAARPARAGAPGKPVAAAPAVAPSKPAAADDSDDDQSAPGQDAVETALDALSSRVRGCFVKYQIKGTARVRLVATPAGTAESVSVTGDFEDTPTGLCVEAVVSGAKLPTFKGPPLKLSQSYQLR